MLIKRLAPACLIAALTLETAMAQTPAEELRTTLDDQQAVAVTIYNDDLALVKDQRRVSLPAGRSALAFRDVSARIQPETALLRGVDGAAPRVVEQNFDFDLLTPAKLLEKYVGREVGIIQTHPTTGEETEETATVLAASEGVVLRIGDRIEAGSPPGRIVYRDIPSSLRDRPTLVMTLDGAEVGERTLELSYLTEEIGEEIGDRARFPRVRFRLLRSFGSETCPWGNSELRGRCIYFATPGSAARDSGSGANVAEDISICSPISDCLRCSALKLEPTAASRNQL